MLIYRKGSPLSVLLRMSGSVLPRTAPLAFLCAMITVVLQANLSEDFLHDLFEHPYPFQPLFYIVAFVVVFRTNVAYNRYWESATQVSFMAAKWGDAIMQTISFDMFSRPRAGASADAVRMHRERRLWQAKVLHKASLLHAVSLQYLRRDDDVSRLRSKGESYRSFREYYNDGQRRSDDRARDSSETPGLYPGRTPSPRHAATPGRLPRSNSFGAES
jgi:predicted membrane chloride channel (bestrophin family)